MSAQRAELCIGQASLGTFDVSAVPKPHELHFRVYPRGLTNFRDSMRSGIVLVMRPRYSRLR